MLFDIILAYKELSLGNRVGPQESYYILTKKGNKFKLSKKLCSKICKISILSSISTIKYQNP